MQTEGVPLQVDFLEPLFAGDEDERLPSGTYPGDVESDAVNAGLRRHVEGAAVLITPGQVVWVFWSPDDAQSLSPGREYPQATRPANVQIPFLIDLYPVNGFVSRSTGHVVKDFAR